MKPITVKRRENNAVISIRGRQYYDEDTSDSIELTTAFSAVLGALALFEPFLNFVNGLFDVTALVYYAGVAGLFLFLTGQALEKRRWN